MPRQRKSQAEEALNYAAERMQEQITTFRVQRDYLTAKIDALTEQREEIANEAKRIESERAAKKGSSSNAR